MEVVAVAGFVIAVPSVVGWLCCRCRNSNPLLVTSPPKPPTSPSLNDQHLEKELGAKICEEAVIYDETFTRTHHDSGSVLTVKVEVHSSSSGAGSDENMSSSDLSERGSGSGAGGEHDYEDIYLVRTEAGKPRSRSRDSGSHSRSASLSSTNSNVIITETITQPELPLPNGSIPSQKPQVAEIKSCDDHSHGGKAKLNHSHSMPYQPANNRALKRVVSEPGSALPPPPPPPPPDDLSLPSSPEHSIHTVTNSQSSQSSSADSSSVEEASTLRASSASPADSADTSTATAESVPVVAPTPVAVVEPPHAGPNLVNKQMVLPFIPPKFPSSGDGDEHSLIKPSEYLRALGNKPAAPPLVINKPEPLPAVHTFQPEDKTGAAVVTAGPPPPPLPESPPTVALTPHKTDQPLGTISIQDLNSVQLRRTNKVLSKTMSAPPSSLTGTVEGPFQVAKQDLIEELKKSKDITGIKKMKVEKVKMEEQHEKELVTEIAKHLSVDSFVEKIPEKDGTGNPIPPWKRQMLAKKAAEKARKEMEEELAREAEERRLQSIPAWKRQLMQSKKVDEKPPTVYSTPIIDDKKPIPAVEIIEKNTLNLTKENKENNKPQPVAVHKENIQVTQTKEEETAQIIPWRAQLRKTNSTLNLLE